MERKFFVNFYRPETFGGVIDVDDNWDDMSEDQQREWLDLYFQENQGIRAVEVDEFDAYE